MKIEEKYFFICCHYNSLFFSILIHYLLIKLNWKGSWYYNNYLLPFIFFFKYFSYQFLLLISTFFLQSIKFCDCASSLFYNCMGFIFLYDVKCSVCNNITYYERKKSWYVQLYFPTLKNSSSNCWSIAGLKRPLCVLTGNTSLES